MGTVSLITVRTYPLTNLFLNFMEQAVIEKALPGVAAHRSRMAQDAS